MESMFTRKKTVLESEQMISDICTADIRKEFYRQALLEKVKLSDLERQKLFEQRMKDCEKLNELIKADNQELMDSVFNKPDLAVRDNPFYMALVAQKEERDRYK
jgi:hypothetical protein